MSGTRDESHIEDMVDKWLGETNNSEPETIEGEASEASPPAPVEGEAPKPSADTPPKEQSADGQQKPAGDKERPAEQVQKANPGDLVDREGKVIARAGPERRHYETAQRTSRELQQVRAEYERVNTELNAFRQAAQLPTQLGLTPDESTTGLQLVASWKQNPVGVIQYLVEQAKAAGHNLDSIGGTTDVGAIKAMIANELAPLREQAQTVQQQHAAQTAAQEQVHSLVGEYGEQALVNGEALSKLIDASMDAGRPLNLEQAYLRFSNWCFQNGFDPHQPIDPQIAAKSAPQQQQAPATQQRNPPRPNGRAVAAPNGVIPMDTASTVSGNESTRDLVRLAMRDAGFNV